MPMTPKHVLLLEFPLDKKVYFFSVLVFAAAVFFTAVPAFSSVPAAFVKGTLCPVMQGKRANEKFYVDYQGERIYFCCRSCMRAFKKHPDRYLAALNDAES